MSIRGVFIAALSAATLLAANTVKAADLDQGAPYDDPRYGDIYRHPAPPPPRYAVPHPPPPVYREERFAEPPPYRNDGRVVGDCVPQRVIRERLTDRGWQDFHDPQVAGNVVHIRASRPSGRLFELTIDRCTGEVLQAEAIGRRSAGIYPPAPPPPEYGFRQPRFGGY